MSGLLEAAQGQVTGIGSLPFVGASEAVETVARLAPVVPWWPQLPRRTPHEGMLRQFLGAASNSFETRPFHTGYFLKDGEWDGVIRWLESGNAALDDVHAAGFGSFLDAVSEGRFPDAALLKGQLTGPVTLARYLHVRDRSGLEDGEFVAALASRLARCAADQVERLGAHGHPVMIWVDEPGAGRGGDDAAPLDDAASDAVRFVLDAIRDRGGIAGLHCCSPVRGEWIRELAPDVLAFDAAIDEKLLHDPDIAAWRATGGVPVPGFVDPIRGAIVDLDEAAREAVARGLRTTTCGLATTAPADVDRIFDAVATVQ